MPKHRSTYKRRSKDATRKRSQTGGRRSHQRSHKRSHKRSHRSHKRSQKRSHQRSQTGGRCLRSGRYKTGEKKGKKYRKHCSPKGVYKKTWSNKKMSRAGKKYPSSYSKPKKVFHDQEDEKVEQPSLWSYLFPQSDEEKPIEDVKVTKSKETSKETPRKGVMDIEDVKVTRSKETPRKGVMDVEDVKVTKTRTFMDKIFSPVVEHSEPIPDKKNQDKKDDYFANNPKKGKAHSQCMNSVRDVVIMKVPKYIRDKGWKNKNLAFFKSTDTSNVKGFKDVYFPFYGFLMGGWFVKATERAWLHDKQLEDTLEADWKKEIFNRAEDDYVSFLEKFGFYFQLRMSAVCGGEFWDRPDMVWLRDLALYYNYDDKEKEFYRDGGISSSCKVVDCIEDKEMSIWTIQQWMDDNDATLKSLRAFRE